MARVRFQFRNARAERRACRRFQRVEHDHPSHAEVRQRPVALEVELPPGRHEYKFLVDGKDWWNDPDAPKTPNLWGSENSYVDVA